MTQNLSTAILRALHERQARVTLDDLCIALGVTEQVARDGVRRRALRREDVRAAVRELDALGFVDASRMRLTLQGFAVAASLGPAVISAGASLHLVA